MMEENSSENENKVFTLTVTRPCKSGRNHPKAWKSGRGAVASVKGAMSTTSNSLFCLQFLKKHSNLATIRKVDFCLTNESRGWKLNLTTLKMSPATKLSFFKNFKNVE
jgi:hypothetical protein